MKRYMIDLETTGVKPQEDDILQLAIVEMNWVNGFWKPGEYYQRFFHTDRQPRDEFAIKHMAPLYKFCNDLPYVPQAAAEIRAEILAFFAKTGAGPKPVLSGQNFASFDLQFLLHKGFLQPSDYDYHIYDTSTAIDQVMEALGKDNRYAVMNMAIKEANQSSLIYKSPWYLEEKRKHDALWDDFNQINMVNGLLYMLRTYNRPFVPVLPQDILDYKG